MQDSGSEQLSEKDCRTCRRRRIICDRTLPCCRKCSGRAIECPGYGLNFRWTNAISVRGPLAYLPSTDAVKVLKRSSARKKGLDSPDDTSQHHSGPVFPEYSESLLLPDALVSQLFAYYSRHITPMMVWLDSDQNEYRRFILPMAYDHPILRLAICAISAAHMPNEPIHGRRFSAATCEAAITKITEHVRRMNTNQDTEVDCLTDEWIDISVEGTLAAMLILANQSLFASELSQALFHRQAARILLHTLSSQRSTNDELFVFLKNQLALCDVLSCTTLFSANHIQTIILPELGRGDIVLGRFLVIVHRITESSLQALYDNCRDSKILLTDLENEFELAQGSTLLAAGRVIESREITFRDDFIRLMQLYTYAGILYAYKRLQLDLDQVAQHYIDKLLTTLGKFHDIDAVIHNLAWPLFIGGICDDQIPERRVTISKICKNMSENTGFGHYSRILDFLQDLWQTPHQDWVILAKCWEEKGQPLVAV